MNRTRRATLKYFTGLISSSLFLSTHKSHASEWMRFENPKDSYRLLDADNKEFVLMNGWILHRSQIQD